MWRVIQSLLLSTLLAAPVIAQQASGDDIRRLDDQVQEVKTEALDIAAELELLEKRLLYPSETRLTVALAMDTTEGVRLGAVKIHVDGELVAQHLYSDAELEALRQGGVQNLYTGNVTLGKHELAVSVNGALASGASFEETARHEFTKDVDARTLAIKLVEPGRDSGRIRVDDR